MKAMNIQKDIPSIPIDSFKDHYVLVFNLTSMQDATEYCFYPEPVGEPLRLELNFTFPLKHVSELIALGRRKFLVAVDRFGVVRKKCLKRIKYLSSKYLIVSRYSKIGTLVHFPLTMFQFSSMRLLQI